MITIVKKCNSFARLIKSFRHLDNNFWNNLVFNALGTSDLSISINMKILDIKLGNY